MRSVSYRASLVALVLSPVLAIGWYLFAVTEATHQANDFDSVPFRLGDARGQVVLFEGPHTLWLEGAYVSLRRNSATEYRRVLSARVTRCDTQTDVPIRRVQSQVFNVGGREGRSMWRFDVREPGPHCITVKGRYVPGSTVMWPREIAVGEGVGLRVPVRPWFAVILLVGLTTAMALALRTHSNRRRLVNSGWSRADAVESRR